MAFARGSADAIWCSEVILEAYEVGRGLKLPGSVGRAQ